MSTAAVRQSVTLTEPQFTGYPRRSRRDHRPCPANEAPCHPDILAPCGTGIGPHQLRARPRHLFAASWVKLGCIAATQHLVAREENAECQEKNYQKTSRKGFEILYDRFRFYRRPGQIENIIYSNNNIREN
jgi:hypothetical protein